MFQLKSTHKVVKDYFAEVHKLTLLGAVHEGAVAPAFANLLRAAAQPFGWTLAEQYARTPRGGQAIRIDGALLDNFRLARGYWEAKDSADDLDAEISRKLDAGYPQDNILFQSPARIVVIQQRQRVWDAPASEPETLVAGLRAFFAYQPPAFERWQQAVEEFKSVVPELAGALLELIEGERRGNQRFIDAFGGFADLCRVAINPNISDHAVEEMLIQHLLTERIFRRVFDNPDFVSRNVIAREIEKVARALTSQRFSRRDFFRPLDRFFAAIETTAATINDFSEKQGFLNTVYEQFFQGFSVEVADTHGIVYTPQAIVDFMVRSIDALLRREFGRSMADSGVHLLDPFVGTGNFILRVMRHLAEVGKLGRLPHKYAHELHCNEVMLLPYYIAAMNIEHEYYELTSQYAPFAGICLVDTFELAEEIQMSLFAPENTARVQAQQSQEITVIVGNPPYNVGQVNENDNNKNRKYATMDKRVRDTYSQTSKATNKNALADPYVKAIRWAADRIGNEGIVAFVSNSGFLDGVAADGMRKHLENDFDAIYVLDLGGNVRKNPKLSGTTHNVFGIQVGVSISFFVKKGGKADSPAEIFYARVDESWRKEEKYRYLDAKQQYGNVDWTKITPDKRHIWLTEGLHADFETFISLGNREAKATKGETADVIFKVYSRGVSTGRDAWAYNFKRNVLIENMSRTIETYNEQVFKWERLGNKSVNVDDFVAYDDKRISWSRDLKAKLKRGRLAEFVEQKVRESLYRPYTKSNLYFDRTMDDMLYVFPSFFPTPETENANQVIWLKVGADWPIFALMVNRIPNLLPQSGSQCFPFYTYDEDGSNRRENITDWALALFRTHYQDDTISKWDIFHYVYGLLHHPGYRERYQANLKRDLPRIPFAPDFPAFAAAGARLAEIHVSYEEMPAHALEEIESPGQTLDYRVEKMRLSKDRTQIRYNGFLTLGGVPAEAFEYQLGNRSALEWVINQYRVKTDKRSGIVNDSNRADDPHYVVNLIGRVIAVSLETMEIVAGLPGYR